MFKMKTAGVILFSGWALALPAQSVSENNNQFAFELFAKLEKNDKNVFLSPYSISTALAMTYTGAKGKTAECMEKVMHFSGGKEKVSSDFSELMSGINSLNGKDIEINVANRLYGNKGTEFVQEFLNNLEKKFNAPLEKMDFKNDPEGCRKIINKWVEDKTKNRIKELLKPNILTPDTRLVLVNAIYFYGDWAHQFDSAMTKKGDFFLNEQEKKEAQLMWQKHSFEYMEADGIKAVRLPYKGNTLSMEIFLPDKKDGIGELEKKFNQENYSKWIKKFFPQQVHLTLPKFKMTTDFKLEEILKPMGMELAFSDFADFSGMSVKTLMKIDKVIHKAFVEVSEKGTEAAAATAVIMEEITSAYRQRETYKIFKADHPFLFTLRDNKTGSILFMGKVNDPTL
ncbi:MAG: serpin family protein [Bacteroidota bacterium]